MPYAVTSERLVVRCYDPTDAPALLEATAASRDHLLPWLPWAAAEPQTLDEKVQLLRTFRSEFDRDGDYVVGAFEREGGRLVGGSGLHPRCGEGCREIGYWVRVDACGRGIATEMAAAMTYAGFRHLGLRRIEIRCHVDNSASSRVIEKLGYRREGTLLGMVACHDAPFGDAEVWGMLASEYASSPVADYAFVAHDALGRELAQIDTQVERPS